MLKRWIGFGWMGLCLFVCLGLVAGCPSAVGGGEGEEEPACAAAGEACTADADCCDDLICGDDGTCMAEEEPPECAAEGEACTANEDCCEGLVCGEDGTCITEEEPPECAAEGEACTADEDCCEGLVCGEDGTCVAEEEPPECAAEGEACDEETVCCEGLNCVDGVCTALGDPAERFATSLHAAPRRGQQYFYETSGDGFYTLTDVPYDELGCGACHKNPLADGTEPTNDEYVPSCGDCHEDPADPTIAVADDICLSCHSRQNAEQNLFTDVHRDRAGLACTGCHGDLDMHGDGTEYNSLLETRFVRCEDCHIEGMNPDAPIVDPTTHDGHGGDKLDCSACHVESVVTCYSCHFETEAVAKLGKRWFGQSPLSGYKMLVNYDGKVYPGTFMTLTFQGQTFLTIAPYYAHNVVAFDGPINCGMCHRQSGAGNAAVEAYFNGEPIVVTQWLPDEEGTDRLAGPTGVIPVTPNWRTDLVFDFLDYTGDPADAIDGEANLELWDVITNGLDGSHMPFGSPLTDDQMTDLTQY